MPHLRRAGAAAAGPGHRQLCVQGHAGPVLRQPHHLTQEATLADAAGTPATGRQEDSNHQVQMNTIMTQFNNDNEI